MVKAISGRCSPRRTLNKGSDPVLLQIEKGSAPPFAPQLTCATAKLLGGKATTAAERRRVPCSRGLSSTNGVGVILTLAGTRQIGQTA